MFFDLIARSKLIVLLSGKDDGLSSFLSWLTLSLAEKSSVAYVHSDTVIRPHYADGLSIYQLGNFPGNSGIVQYLSESFVQQFHEHAAVVVDDFSHIVVRDSGRSVINALCAKFEKVIVGVKHINVVSPLAICVDSATSSQTETLLLPTSAETFTLNRRGGVTTVENKSTCFQFRAVANGDMIEYKEL